MEKYLMIIAAVLLFYLGAVVYIIHSNSAPSLVYKTCQESRLEIDWKSEALCGALQDRFGFEYLCEESNNLKTNKCWVEKK